MAERKLKFHYAKKGIARKLILATMLFSVLTTLLVVAIQLLIDYHRDVEAINYRIEQIRIGQLESIAKSTWDFDKESVQLQIEGLLQLPDIEYVEVEANGVIQNVGEKKSENVILVEMPLVYLFEGDIERIGTLRMMASLDLVFGRLYQKALTILIFVGFLIFLITGFLFLIFQRLVTRHLHVLAIYTSNLSLDQNSPPLTLNRPKSIIGKEDEIDDVVNAINTMRTELADSILQLHKSEQRLSRHIQNTPLGCISWDSNFRCTEWNKSAEKIFGYSSDEVIGHLIPEIIMRADNRDDIKQFETLLLNQTKGGQKIIENITKDGKAIICDWYSTPIVNSNGVVSGVASLVLDITESKRVEEKQRHTEELISTVVKNSPIILWALDQNGILTLSEGKGLYRQGFKPKELVGQSIFELYKGYPDFLFNVKRAFAGESFSAINETEGSIFERWYEPIKDEEGEVKGLIGVSLDITERTTLENQLRQAQKMEAVGQLTGGIAHDFNNMLAVIMGNLELLRRQVKSDSKALEYVERAYAGIERGANITKKLLSFSRQDVHRSKLTNVNTFITGMENLISKSLTPIITIETLLGNDIWNVITDPGDFEDSILNLALNSRDAMPDGGSLVIETTNKVLDEYYVQRNPGSTAGEHVMISVSDNGTGMMADVIDKIFQPFFTTKEQGKGTGLGMSMVYGFVQRSGGYIEIYSVPDKGTTFRIFLPREIGEANATEATYTSSNEEIPRGNETVLIVDDEEELLKIAVLYLEDLGYKAITADDGKHALELLQGQHHIDLLFSDIVMPGGMDGYDIAKDVLESPSETKVLLTSGFTPKQKKILNADIPFFDELNNNLLPKPYNRFELGMAVRRVLDGKGRV